MGSGASQQQEATIPSTPINAVNNQKKGENTKMTSPSNDQDKVGDMPDIPKKKIMLGEKKQTASSMVRTVLMREVVEEQELEQKVLKSNTAMMNVFKGFEKCKAFLIDDNNKADPFDEHFADLLVLLTDHVIKMFTKHSKDDERVVMGNRLAEIGFVGALVKYYTFVMDEIGLIVVTEGFVDEARNSQHPGELTILKVREILWNFSDNSTRFSERIAETDMLQKLVEDLRMIFDDGLDQIENTEDRFAFSSAVGILHNCARNPNIDKECFRSIDTVDVLCNFIPAKDYYVKIITLLAIGNMIKEDEVDKMHAGVDVLEVLLEAIKMAADSRERKWNGFHLSELVDGLATLAQSDKNKKLIMSKKPMPLITKIMKSETNGEVLAAIKLAWELAFLPENKEIINQDAGFMKELKRRTNDKDKHIFNAATGASFVIEGMSSRIERAPSPPPVAVGGAKQAVRPAGKHIMFSYSWGDKEMVYRIYNKLISEGHTIWIDFQEMGKYANLLEGMANAVEHAHTILVCFSEKYKNSQNCRTEADYAFTLRKNIIPLKMQQGYAADGWLGAFIGARLYIEFTQKYPFDRKMEELREQLKPSPMSAQSIVEPPSPSTTGPPARQTSHTEDTQQPVGGKRLTDWQKHDVDHWIAENGMSAGSFKLAKQLTGAQLGFLCKVSRKAPDTFYRWCDDKLKLKSIQELMLFSDAIEKLPL